MVELLEGFDISLKTTNILEENLTSSEKEELENCIERFYSAITYLREIGVSNETIEEIILEDHHVLIAGRKNIETALSKINNIQGFVQMLNNDVNYMSFLKNIN